MNVAGGLVEILYWNSFNDEVGEDATFPLGVGVATLTINYTLPTPATIAWYDAASAGTNLGTGSPFETVGTSVLPNTTTPGVYTFFAEGQFGGCPSASRTAVTVTVLATSTSTTVVSQCDSSPYTWTDGNTYSVSGTYTQTLTNAAGCDSIATLQLTLTPSTSSTTTITNCGTYTWTDGNTYSASGTFTQTLVNANGCDSIATLDLTILNNSSSVTSISSCTPYTWTDGNTYSATGSYQQTLTNSIGCDSIATLVFTLNSFNATVTDNGNNTLTASSGTSYQWINCTTNTAVAGATTQNFAPTSNGNYAVVVTNASGCSDTSVCVLISTIGIKENNSGIVDVFPNPTHDNVTITMSAPSASVQIMDAQGKVLNTVSIKTGDIVSLAKYETGVYFLKITTDSGSTLERIVKN